MTIRSPVSAPEPIWYDSQQVDETDLQTQQTANSTIESSILNNHIGTGVLPENLVQPIIFDSSLATGFLDGLAISPQSQPTDNTLGNQLALTLTGSDCSVYRTVKVCIIGLDFQSNLQYETFVFKTNEIQVSAQHFTKILVLLFNDLYGNTALSFNLGGDLVISQAQPMELSRDAIMTSQDIQPNLFFRDFFLDPSLGPITLQTMLQAAMPTYNVADLNIMTSGLGTLILSNGDVTTQLGEKFQATTNNIQKITLLISVQNLVAGQQNNLVWTGDLIVSIYPLQTMVTCPTDLAPGLPTQFAPSNIPVAQISFNYNSLLAAGVLLNSVPQPIDFVFSNTPAAVGNLIQPGNYYCVAVNRAGNNNQCDLLFTYGYLQGLAATFTGSLWVDLPNQDLWFRIYTDAAKVADGQAYDTGNGVTIPKTTTDLASQATIDYSYGPEQFTGNDTFRAVLTAVTVDSASVPDARTGNPVDSRQQLEPQVNLLGTIDITNLEVTTEPLILGTISDKNIKTFTTNNIPINSLLYSATVVNNQMLIRIIDDPTDPRFNTLVSGLASSLLNGQLVGAQITPDGYNPSLVYRVANARLCSMIWGDVDGNGIIDDNDLTLLDSYLGYNLNVGLPVNTTVTTTGQILGATTTFVNGYNTLTVPFSNLFSVEFQLVDPTTNIVVADGYDGVLVANPANPRLAQFTSASVAFNTIVGLSSYNLVVLTNTAIGDYGGFNIVSIDSLADVLTIQKVFLNEETLEQILRADINGDFIITASDGYLLDSYIERQTITVAPPTTYPAPTTNPYTKIGTRFNVIRLELEQYVDRTDDYDANPNMRNATVHPLPDIFLNDGYFASYQYFTTIPNPLPVSFTQQLTWDDSLIITDTQAKLVPSVFTSITGYNVASCFIDGVQCNVYPVTQSFDPGTIDYFVPNNLIIGTGELKRPDGDFYKVDFEVGTIVLEIPDGYFGSERTIDLFNDFMVDTTGNGATYLGFPSMRFADCTFVGPNALADDQVRFSVAVQSFSPNLDGYDTDGYYGAIVDGKMGVSVDYATGLLTLNFSNLYQDAVLQTLSTKIQVNVFLKKGGFNNQPLFVNSTQVQNMLALISVFSGANEGGVSALVDLGSDVTGILPILNGGTGLNGVGAVGTVLTSTGSGLSYSFAIAPYVGYVPATPSDWESCTPLTVQSALDRIAAMLFNLFGPIPCSSTPPFLTFAILAGSAITNTGATVITGNIGSYPTPTITGFPPGTIIGTNHAGDAFTQSAKTALTSDYNAAQALPGAVTIATDLNGQTLTPGVYSSLSGTFSNSGTVTLNGAGNYTFQMATTLITSSASTVVLTGGATAANVTWAVGSSATLGTTSNLQGSILALTSITDNGGSTVTGALLAQNGAVTLNDTIVTLP
jgi:hypothetical protein